MKIVEKRERKSNAKSRVEAAMKIIEGGVDLDSRLLATDPYRFNGGRRSLANRSF